MVAGTELENKEVVGNDLVGVLVARYRNFAVKYWD